MAKDSRSEPHSHIRAPQVADWIESRIKSGELKSGSRLPPERELAQDTGVAYDTIRRAAVLLRERGLIITVHGRGTYVA
jgi:DNA-binding GntR family transcriptional regulator